jgi:hypothetical protein
VPRKKRLVTDCSIDPDRLDVFRDCLETYGMDDRAPQSEWPWNVLAKSTIAYSCGLIARRGEIVEHQHDPDEFALCRRLADAASGVMGGRDVGMGSNSSDPFRPYYVVANVGGTVPRKVTVKLIRQVFGGSIYPPTRIVVEPLEEEGDWWSQVVEDGSGSEGYLEPWRALMRWFHDQSELRAPAFVMVGDDPLDDDFANGGCVFPRMAVALSKAGSLVGLGGWCVHA